ncbi:hypothetical protein A9Q83_08085 [Alphaproteobacteria bacterium 46_93_T64]|nr:hypothetical protein A9Q83_08085 [Alphaproteobacteria bacterium 46_93_T64]
MVPFLLCVLGGYFFFFGLLFETLLLDVFDINYLQYAGLEDLFLNMIRFGAIVSLFVGMLWISYALILCVVFSCLLICQMVRSTRDENLNFISRVKIIGLSISVLFLNIMLRVIYFIPSIEGRRGKRIVVSQENFTRVLFNLRSKRGKLQAGRPFLTARHVFQNFLYFRTMGNHRLVIFSLLIFVLSFGLTYFATEKAEYARACALLSTGTVLETSSPAAYSLAEPCRFDTEGGAVQTAARESRTSNTLKNLFGIIPVVLKTNDGPVQLLHLRTTSRFDLFFDGRNNRSLVIPKGILVAGTDTEKVSSMLPTLTRLEKKFTVFDDKLETSLRNISGFKDQLKETNSRISLLKTSQQLDMLRLQSKSIHEKAKQAVTTSLQIPKECWKKEPDYIVSYKSGEYTLMNAEVLDQIVRLSIEYRSHIPSNLVITGYADNPGSKQINQKISTLRAENIGALFERLGLTAHQIIAFGMGENDSLRYPQRRTEIRSCNVF